MGRWRRHSRDGGLRNRLAASLDLGVNQLGEKRRCLRDALRGVRHEVLIHAVDTMPAHSSQFAQPPPSFCRLPTETPLWSVNEVEDNVGIDGQQVLLCQPPIAALGPLHDYAASCDLDKLREEAALGGGAQIAKGSGCPIDNQHHSRLRKTGRFARDALERFASGCYQSGSLAIITRSVSDGDHRGVYLLNGPIGRLENSKPQFFQRGFKE